MEIKIEELWNGTGKLPSVDWKMEAKIKKNWDRIAKPLDSLGLFETYLARIGAIQGKERPALEDCRVAVFCADNGVVEEGVSQSEQKVTAICAENIAKGSSAVGIMAKHVGASVHVIDVGMNILEKIPNVENRSIMKGTHNFAKEPAMSVEETMKALQVGFNLAKEWKEQDCGLILTGEMGIGNTTTSSAMAAAYLPCELTLVTGRGAGLSDEGLERKRKVIRESLERFDLFQKKDAISILSKVGGLDIAALTGLCIGGAYFKIPVLLDGVISMVAALTAEKLVPGVKDFLIPSHSSKEPAALMIEKELGLQPVIWADMALGEGTGAVMMLGLLKTANEVYQKSNTFQGYGIDQYQRESGNQC